MSTSPMRMASARESIMIDWIEEMPSANFAYEISARLG